MARSLPKKNAQAHWAAGYGVVSHTPETAERVIQLAETLREEGVVQSSDEVFQILAAADRLTNAAMWVVVHMTYANRVDLAGGALSPADFKASPQGHTGGSLNVVPAYVGYLAANLLSGVTRGWILGQGHCAAAVEAANALVGNLSPTQADRYGPDEAGLSRLVSDFYSYAIDSNGRASAPVGSHVTPHTAGSLSEGGYLGFAETQYVHIPLPGESLVAILSDGAFEEQRGGDFSERWWRAEDCGLVAPVMIVNGRRIEQRTEIAQDGGGDWLSAHLATNGFDPFLIDGRDPAAFAWAILESERRLRSAVEKIKAGQAGYPVRLPFAIARTVKGYGFPGAGANKAHNLPLPASPRADAASRELFTAGAARLHVPQDQLAPALRAFAAHDRQGRSRERDNSMAHRRPALPHLPDPAPASAGGSRSPTAAMDAWFTRLVVANPGLRVRVGNPDELRSNGFGQTLELLRHRVNRPEAGNFEAINGAVITALNEEAVVGAALGNKAGLNLVVSYEAFATKMLGALRQEIIFARQQVELARAPGWLAVPLVATSHVWENGKNQQSHQDPTIGEALLGEMSDVSRVLFPPDAGAAVECLRSLYGQRGVVGCVVAPKQAVPDQLTASQAVELVTRGCMELSRDKDAQVQLVAIGAYQLIETVRAAERLRERGVQVSIACVLEPGRLRYPRDEHEAALTLTDDSLAAALPAGLAKVLAVHTRPEAMIGVLRRIDGGPRTTRVHGYINRGGTLDTFGMLFANRSTWAHIVSSAADLLLTDRRSLLSAAEVSAVDGVGDPERLR